MDAGLIAVAAFSLAGTGLSGWLSLRASKTSSKVEEKAVVFEGYDELVDHLRGRVNELENALSTVSARARRCEDECVAHRRELGEAHREIDELRREFDEIRHRRPPEREHGEPTDHQED